MLGVVVGELAHASGKSLYKVRVYWGVCSKGHHESLDAVGGLAADFRRTTLESSKRRAERRECTRETPRASPVRKTRQLVNASVVVIPWMAVGMVRKVRRAGWVMRTWGSGRGAFNEHI